MTATIIHHIAEVNVTQFPLFLPQNVTFTFAIKGYRKLTIHTSGETIQAYSTISQAAQKTGSRFLQCHKSFLVNMDRVKTMERSHFIMDDSSYVPISRGMLQKTRERFFEYLGEL